MKIINLDFTGCKNLCEMHERIRVAFDFPEWYGGNWDAFWDLLWSECDADKVIIKGEAGMPENLEKHIKIMHEALDDKIEFRRQCHFNEFSYEIID